MKDKIASTATRMRGSREEEWKSENIDMVVFGVGGFWALANACCGHCRHVSGEDPCRRRSSYNAWGTRVQNGMIMRLEITLLLLSMMLIS